ncbi:MerR family transcriptional regulator [Iamia sp. SCSIO 61187]|uniref:MerR family transcriptional regulator n=1 Tax=Iamia sp. SCSIO 61187 TaxID=2722752 RepID=UPI001C638C07|nr:MerR family transcriptional regulator [Iamia sp. SCSIO 61187]QYG93874.1 MerR family transcriptional regulator [Iamia sp. SCSIO 61187]
MVDQATGPDDDGLSIDQLAAASGVPSRTIRQYQTLGLLPRPERHGRLGVYRSTHLDRLRLIGRLQERGYSLAGISDLLASWSEGAGLAEVLGLEPGALDAIDEPGAAATVGQLEAVLPALVPSRVDELIATGVVGRLDGDRLCVNSPSLLQLAIDVIEAGFSPEAVLELLQTIRTSTDAIASAVADLLADPPDGVAEAGLSALARRGRGPLARGTGRLTIHRLGDLLAARGGLDGRGGDGPTT